MTRPVPEKKPPAAWSATGSDQAALVGGLPAGRQVGAPLGGGRGHVEGVAERGVAVRAVRRDQQARATEQRAGRVPARGEPGDVAEHDPPPGVPRPGVVQVAEDQAARTRSHRGRTAPPARRSGSSSGSADRWPGRSHGAGRARAGPRPGR